MSLKYLLIEGFLCRSLANLPARHGWCCERHKPSTLCAV